MWQARDVLSDLSFTAVTTIAMGTSIDHPSTGRVEGHKSASCKMSFYG